VLSADSNTATAAPLPRANFKSATSSGPSSGTPVEETGTVKWFNAEKGFGFIARDGGGKDVFVHISALALSGLTALNEGERVTFDVAEGRKGLESPMIIPGTDSPRSRQARSTSTRNGCSSTLAINKTSHCFCTATSKV
jgi:CspA family cold shock protein